MNTRADQDYTPDGASNTATWEPDRGRWLCHCDTYLPPAPLGAGTVVTCPRCGDAWQYGHWALNRWKGDRGSTSLEPRRIIARGYGAVTGPGRDAA
jgi:hypothetical protein